MVGTLLLHERGMGTHELIRLIAAQTWGKLSPFFPYSILCD